MIGEEGPPTNGGGVVTLSMTDVNPQFVCVLCFGYFIDATTIAECLHTFCKSCIVNFLSSNHHCPHCDALLSRTRPLSSLRPDRVMQSLVYKTVPGLFQTEMRRRIQFYQENPHPDFVADLEGVQNYIFNPDDSISLSIRYYSFKDGEENGSSGLSDELTVSRNSTFSQDFKASHSNTLSEEETGIPDIRTIRYFRCPATVPVSVLKSLIKTKYRIPDFLRVELLYGEECLLDSWTLMEVAYIFQWNRESPMELTFQVLITRKVKRKRLRLVRKVRKSTKTSQCSKSGSSKQHPSQPEDSNHFDEPPHKKTKVDVSPTLSASDENNHPRPLTPPETPDDAQDTFSDTDTSLKSSSMRIKREVCFSPQRPNAKELSQSNNVYFKESNKNDLKKQNFDNDYSITKDIQQIQTKLSSVDVETAEESLSDDMNSRVDELPEGTCDLDGDQDSEGSLEVDTSHETEPEPDNEADGSIDSNNYKDTSNMNEFDDEEQGDSAIDVNDLSASEVMDSDDKDTDFNASSESLDIDGEQKNELCVKSANVTDRDGSDSGVLDLSSHARSVRAKRKDQSDSSTTPSLSPLGENDRDLTAQTLITSSLSGNPITMTEKLKELLPIGQSLLARGAIPPRPALPMDWVRPPLVNPAGVPHAAAFRDLVTLSHAAVQLQIAMAHAQAQAQAQTQKIQSQVQTNVLKNLKSSESLSFVNGSGDTLTISPIVGSQGDKKPKNTKMKVKPQLPCLNGQTKSQQITSQKNRKIENSSVKNKIHVNGNMNSSHLNSKQQQIPTKNHASALKIPRVQVSSHQNGNIKSDKQKEKREITDKDVERTGDPVFQITNQKLSAFVRQQRLNNNKLKQNVNKNLNSTDISSETTCSKSQINNSNCTISPSTHSKPPVNSVASTISQSAPSKLGVKQVSTISPTYQSNSNDKLNLAKPQKDNTATTIINRNKLPVSTPSTMKSTKPVMSANSLRPSIPSSPSIQSNGSKTAVSLPSANISQSSPSLMNGKPQKPFEPSKLHNNNTNNNNNNRIANTATTTFSTKSLISITPSLPTNSIRTTNTSVRQIPNPSRLHQQSENRLSVGMGRLSGVLPKKGLSSGSQTEGLSRIESLTRSLHEKVAASAAAIAASGGVLNTAAR